jgi:hypothetical protein
MQKWKQWDKITALFLYILLSASLSGCRKYDEGGKYCLTRSHLTATWKLKRVNYNGYDVTNYLLVSNIKQTFKRNEDYSLRFTNAQGVEIVHNGSWSYEKATLGTFDILGSTAGTPPNIYIFNPELKNSPLELCPGIFLTPTDNWMYIVKLKGKDLHYFVGYWEFWYEKE